MEHLASIHGIECRHPFFDRRVIDFLLAIPWELRHQDECTKKILRVALTGVLPEILRKRNDKPNFYSILESEFCVRQAPYAEFLLGASTLGTLGMIDVAKFRSGYGACCRGMPAR